MKIYGHRQTFGKRSVFVGKAVGNSDYFVEFVNEAGEVTKLTLSPEAMNALLILKKNVDTTLDITTMPAYRRPIVDDEDEANWIWTLFERKN